MRDVTIISDTLPHLPFLLSFWVSPAPFPGDLIFG